MSREKHRHSLIEIVPYDPRWPREYERASAELAAALGSNLLALHHIGSTSIPGLHAKPILDMLGVVGNLEAADARTIEMERLGYEAKGEFGIEGRRYFRRDDSTGRRTHHLHVFAEGSPHVLRHLAFRDSLREDPSLAEQYGNLKRQLAADHAFDMEAYLDGKSSFIQEVVARALDAMASSSGRW